MRYRKRSLPDVSSHQAAWRLNLLGGFAQYPVATDGEGVLIGPDRSDSPAQAGLRELMGRHRTDPPAAVAAYADALEVLEEHDAMAAFELWEQGRRGSSSWPTADQARRLRAA